MKKMLTRILTLALALCLLTSFTSAYASSTSVPSTFANEVSPRGYNAANSFAARRGAVYGVHPVSNSSKSYTLDRHNALIAAGWVLVEVREEHVTLPSDIRLAAANSNVVIQDTKIVTSYYTQPRVTKSSYVNKLLNAVSNLATPVTTVIAAALPSAKWVPKAFGYATKAIIDASAKEKIVFTSVSTLRFYEAQCKVAGSSGYTTYASAERYEVAQTNTSSGYKEDGTPFATSGSGSAASNSAHYGNRSWMIAKAREYAMRDDGDFYTEDAPDIASVTITP